jgi:hypothetical protein
MLRSAHLFTPACTTRHTLASSPSSSPIVVAAETHAEGRNIVISKGFR